MKKTILITGATDGIGQLTAQLLAQAGHHLLIHGRSEAKLTRVERELHHSADGGRVETYQADLSDLGQVQRFASQVLEKHTQLDVLINNAGVFKTEHTRTQGGFDVRFMVNTIAPYLLTQKLRPLLKEGARILNLSSAAQATVDIEALRGRRLLDDMAAYAQSKLAITMWTKSLADTLEDSGVVVIAINPGSLLASKMVKEGFGVPGKALGIGADILCRAALSDEFSNATGRYFDNDSGRFAAPHPDAESPTKRDEVLRTLDDVLGALATSKEE